MKRREFITKSSIVTLGVGTLTLASCGGSSKSESSEDSTAAPMGESTMASTQTFTLPDLPYGFDALEPSIDAQTMEIHHDRHHAGYVRKLNAALENHSLAAKGSLEEMLASLTDADTAVRNNGGGHYNHSLFWEIMSPNASTGPEGELADAITAQFGSFEGFKEQFAKKAATVFGSGWAWLVMGDDNKLFVSSTPNQDNPLMKNVVSETGTPILGIDVWEHAYYLKYQNQRKSYIDSFMKIINWGKVSENYKALS